MIRSLIALLLGSACFLSTYAGDAGEWSLRALPGAARQDVELTLTAKVADTWHIYGRTGGGTGQSPLELKLKLPPGVETAGDWSWPKPETVHEGRPIEIYTGTQVFTRKLKVTTATGEVKIKVTVSYQACTHELCGPPEEEELTATLKVDGGADDKPLLVEREKADFSAFAADFRAASAKAAKKEPVDWAPFRERFGAHVARYADLEILGARALDYLTALRQRDRELAEAGWRHLLAVTDANSVANGTRAVRTAAAKQLEAFAIVASGKQFESLRFTAIDGRTIDLSAMKGKVVLLDFWAMWCGPCVAEMPNVKAAYGKYHAQGFEVIGISCDKGTKEQLQAFLDKNGYTWPQHFDGNGTANYFAQIFNITAWPTTYLIGKDGKVIEKNVRGERLEPAIRKALGLDP